jgi:transcriptional regulator
MYVPAHFAVTDPERLAAFIGEHSFATVITQHDGYPFASHLPLLLDRDRGAHGTLVGHMARANLQWRDAAEMSDGIPALAIFSGPHTYISPTWYAEPNTVPTWNYVTVHATGRLRLLEDQTRLLELLGQTVDYYEQALPKPWQLGQQDPSFIQKLLASIVGFEIEVEKLAGKWKLSQNQSAARQERVIANLKQSQRPADHEVAKLMAPEA